MKLSAALEPLALAPARGMNQPGELILRHAQSLRRLLRDSAGFVREQSYSTIVLDEEEPWTACHRSAFVRVSEACRRDEYRGRWESPR